MRPVSAFLPWLISLAVAQTALSAPAHVHGEGEITIAVDKSKIQVEVLAPAESFLGFEHRPKTSKEKKSVDDLKARFERDAAKLFSMPSQKGCTYEMRLFMAFGDDGHEAHRQMGHDHHAKERDGDSKETTSDKHHNHKAKAADKNDHHHHEDPKPKKKPADNKHSHHESHGSGSEHSDVHVVYVLTCKEAVAGSKLEVKLLEAFPKLEKAKVQVLTESKQSATTHSGKAFSVEL